MTARLPPSNVLTVALALVLASLGSSCSMSAHRDRLATDLARRPPIPKSVELVVDCRGDVVSTFGAAPEWEKSLESVLADELGLSEVIETSSTLQGRPRGSPEKPLDSDLRLRLKVSGAGTSPDTTVRTQGAILDFVAWSTVPFLPLFIDDVEVKPALDIELSVDTRVLSGWRSTDEPGDFVPPVATNMLERYPLASWQTLAVLVVPPFFFDGSEEGHLEASIAPHVRRNVAIEIARLVKRASDKELITTPILARREGKWFFSCEGRQDLGLLVFRGKHEHREAFSVTRDPVPPIELRLPASLLESGQTLRIEAVSRLQGDDSVQYYTLRPRPED